MTFRYTTYWLSICVYLDIITRSLVNIHYKFNYIKYNFNYIKLCKIYSGFQSRNSISRYINRGLVSIPVSCASFSPHPLWITITAFYFTLQGVFWEIEQNLYISPDSWHKRSTDKPTLHFAFFTYLVSWRSLPSSVLGLLHLHCQLRTSLSHLCHSVFDIWAISGILLLYIALYTTRLVVRAIQINHDDTARHTHQDG